MEQRRGKDHPETTPPSDPSHIQLQNPDTIINAHKYMLTGAGIAVTWEALLVHDRYTGGHSQPATELGTGSPMGVLKKGPKDLERFADP